MTADAPGREKVKCGSCGDEVLREVGQKAVHQCAGDEPNVVPTMEFKILEPGGKLPTRAKPTDAGSDLTSIENKTLLPGKLTAVDTGIALSAPDGYYITIEGRSSLFQRQVFPVRAIIDATYTGKFIVIFANFGEEPVEIKAGDRIAQLIVHKYVPFDVKIVEEFSPEYSKRGTAGFGSSGR